MGCGDIGAKVVKEAVKYGLEVVIEKGGEAAGVPKPIRRGLIAVVGFFL